MHLTQRVSALSALGLVLFLYQPAFGWQAGGGAAPPGGGGGAAPPGGSGGGGTRPSRPTPGPDTGQPGTGRPGQTFPQPDTGRSPFEIQRPVFLSGKVLTSDGGPPPELATIEIVCNGMPRPYGYTDSKGRFSITLGQPNNVLPDASVGSASDFGGLGSSRSVNPGGGISERQLMGCELRAALVGYRSDVVNLAGRRLLDSPDVGTILLRRLGNVEGFTYSLTTANAPKDAKKAYEKGVDQQKKQKFAEAEENLRKAVTSYPQYAVAWYELGRTLEAQNKVQDAREAYEKAVAADPKYVSPHLYLMQQDATAQNWEALEKSSATVLKLNPFNFPQAWFYNSVANLQMNKLDAAEKSAREALKLDERHRFPKISHVLGIILAQRQEYPEALEHMKGYLTLAPNARDADIVRKEVGEIERVLGKTTVGQAPASTPQTPPKN